MIISIIPLYICIPRNVHDFLHLYGDLVSATILKLFVIIVFDLPFYPLHRINIVRRIVRCKALKTFRNVIATRSW